MYSTYNFLKTFIVICLSSWKIREIILFTVISRIFRGFFAKYTMSTPSDQSNFSVKNDKNFRRLNYGTTYSTVRYHKKLIRKLRPISILKLFCLTLFRSYFCHKQHCFDIIWIVQAEPFSTNTLPSYSLANFDNFLWPRKMKKNFFQISKIYRPGQPNWKF